MRATLRYRRYGVSIFEMTRVPAPLGVGLEGRVTTRLKQPPSDGVAVRLTCIRRTTSGSGRNSSTRERVLWQEEKAVGPAELEPGPVGHMVPVAFPIPTDIAATDDTNPRDRILWRLEVTAAVPGVDFHSAFEVPVFRTPETDRAEQAGVEPAVPRPDPATLERPPGSRIAYNETGDGLEIYFPPARNVGTATATTAFTALWIGAIKLQIHLGAPILFPVVFSLFGLILVWAVVGMWLGFYRVRIDADGLSVQRGLLGMGRTTRLARDAVTAVEPDIGMQSGNRPFYDIKVHTHTGKWLYAARSIRSKQETTWLVARMQSALDLSPTKTERLAS